MIEPRSRSVLDAPPSRGMTALGGAAPSPVIASEATCPPKPRRMWKQSILPLGGEMDCFVASLLAMTALHDKADLKCSTNQMSHSGVARRISAHSPVMRAI